MCARENAPFAVVGRTTNNDELILRDAHFDDTPINMPLSMLLGKPPQMHRVDAHIQTPRQPLATEHMDINEAADRVLVFVPESVRDAAEALVRERVKPEQASLDRFM